MIPTDYRRIIIKRSAVPGTTPTIPAIEPTTEEEIADLNPTDLLVGEFYANIPDDKLWFRTNTGINEISFGTGGGTTGSLASVLLNGNTTNGNGIVISDNDIISFIDGSNVLHLKVDSLTGNLVEVELPVTSGRLALISDIPAYSTPTLKDILVMPNGNITDGRDVVISESDGITFESLNVKTRLVVDPLASGSNYEVKLPGRAGQIALLDDITGGGGGGINCNDLINCQIITDLINNKENISNKVNDLSTPSTSTYPSTEAVKLAIDAISLTPGPTGANGAPGADGREIELRKTTTHIQWRYIGETWQNLVLLSDLKGDKGEKGDKGDKGDNGTVEPTFYIGVNFIDIEDFIYVTGEDMKINSIDNPSSISYTITVNNSPYTLGSTINMYDTIKVVPTGTGYIKLNAETI